MKLEDYFDFKTIDTQFGPVEQIRIKGHRIGIEHVLEQHRKGYTAEQIVADIFPTLTLDEVTATLNYCQVNKVAVEKYLEDGERIGEAFYQECQRFGPPSVAKRIRNLQAQKQNSIVVKNEHVATNDETAPSL